MVSNKRKLKGWEAAWLQHRREFIAPTIAFIFYFSLLRQMEHTKYVYIVLGVAVIIPPLVLVRMVRTAMKNTDMN